MPPSDNYKRYSTKLWSTCDCKRAAVLKQAQIISSIQEQNTRMFQKQEILGKTRKPQMMSPSNGILIPMRTAERNNQCCWTTGFNSIIPQDICQFHAHLMLRLEESFDCHPQLGKFDTLLQITTEIWQQGCTIYPNERRHLQEMLFFSDNYERTFEQSEGAWVGQMFEPLELRRDQSSKRQLLKSSAPWTSARPRWPDIVQP